MAKYRPAAAGELDTRLELQEDRGPSEGTPNTYGEPEERWQTFGSVWASLEPLSGREFWQAQQTQADVTHRVVVRRNALTERLTAACRLRRGTRVFHLAEPPRDHLERREHYEFLVKETP